MILDTTFVIDLMKNRQNAIEKTAELEKKQEPVFITSVTIFELWHSLDAKNKEKREKLEKFTESFEQFALNNESTKKGGEIHLNLISRGIRIDPEDSMIAGIAIKNGQTLLTRDEHFARVKGLRIETY